MINQPEILKHLKDAFKDEQALALTPAITRSVISGIEGKTKDMADLKDLEIVTSKFEASIDKAMRAHTLWTVAIMVTSVTVIITVLKFL